MALNTLDISIDQLELSLRSINALEIGEIKTIRDLVKTPPSELLRLPNFGRKSLNEIKELLFGMSLQLGMSPEQLDYYDGVKPTDKLCEDLNIAITEKAREALKRSTEVILSKNQWSKKDIDDYFDNHEKILLAYKNSVQGYF